MSERADSPEMDERCLALLHAARIRDATAICKIAENILFLCHYAGLRPSWRGMNNLMQVLLRVQLNTVLHEGQGMDSLVAIEEAGDYDPETVRVTNQEKAEAAYHRWRNEKRP